MSSKTTSENHTRSRATDPLIARDLVKYYPANHALRPSKKQWIRAVDHLNLECQPGQTLGLVGESGCGKSTVGRLLVLLEKPDKGQIRLGDSPDLASLNKRRLFSYMRRIQIIFQDPFSSLNPRMTLGDILEEPLDIHGLARGAKRRQRVEELLHSVGLDPSQVMRFPHEFSGGQRQRISIARALAVEPDVIIADEPVSALDVSIQAQIVNLLQDLQEQFGITFLFISHDLSVVGHISHHVAVMYLGRIVEYGSRDQVFSNPLHPYTRALMSAAPSIDPQSRNKRIILPGNVPSPISPPSGCAFHPRCARCFAPCKSQRPELREVEAGHQVACLLYEKSAS